jgi:hypothetical protein
VSGDEGSVASGSRGPARGYLLLAVGAATFGAVALAWPELFARRFRPPMEIGYPHALFRQGAIQLVPGLGAASLVLAGYWAAWGLGLRHASERMRIGAAVAAWVGCYAALSAVFMSWQIDDAAITFAYAENLVRGYGLVLHPNHPPEEAYSNTLWLLLLAGLRAFGLPVHVAAKGLATLLGAATGAAVLLLLRKLVGRWPSGATLALVGCITLTAPFVIWSISGLEHVLQGLLFLAVVASACLRPDDRFTPACFMAALVLVRPEAPLVAASVGGAYALRAWRNEPRLASILRLWPLGVIPALSLAGLLLFRWSYFGDLLPNPYYAKATDATLLRLLNPVGGGWLYVLEWLRDGGVFVLLPLLAVAPWRRAPFGLGVAGAIAAGQLIFIIAAGGDWMGSWRFLAALVPLLGLATGWAAATLQEGPRGAGVTRAALVACLVIVWCTTFQLAMFRGRPTTPTDVVAEVGLAFVELGERLGIEDPKLAHHDAGGTSYVARIDLVDLGGLGNRAIAKGRDDPELLRRMLLEEVRPDFFFGTQSAFAAQFSKLHETRRFAEDYVRVRFPGRRAMRAPLCHVRRDRVREAPWLTVVRDEQGAILEVVVEPPPA